MVTVNALNILYSADQCGAGKTTWALDRMAREVGRYVFVVDRVEVIETRRKELLERFETFGTVAHIEVITAGSELLGAVGPRIQRAGADLSGNPHVIVLITHAGMLRVRDWRGYALWDAIIVDEVPSIMEREEHHSCPWDCAALDKFYSLKPTEVEGVSLISFKGGVSPERLPTAWRKFHDRAVAGGAYCDLGSWADLDVVSAGSWSSWRIWDVTRLEGVFDEITFLGDSFADTDTFHLMSLNPVVRFQRFTVAGRRHWTPRTVSIRYISQDRRAASSRFKDEAFAPELLKVAAWLSEADTDEHLWTSNVGVTLPDVRGERVSPKQAGSNRWASWHKASMIYAAKPSPSERRFYALIGIEPGVIEASREAYDLNQFFMRTSLRNPVSAASVELRCFDRHQAEAFAAKLADGFGLDAEVIWDDIGLEMGPVRRAGRPPANGAWRQTQEERRESNRLAKQRSRDRRTAPKSLKKSG